MTSALEAAPATAVTVDEYLARVLGTGRCTPVVRVELRAARGCVLAENLLSPRDLPLFDNAAMDGYAVRAADLDGGRAALPVSGDVPAGRARPTRLGPGTAVRIMTGAPVPLGADTVVQVEWTDGGTEMVTVRRSPPPGGNIRRRAQEVRRDAPLLSRGATLTPARLGLLAAVGIDQVRVHRRPRVALLTAGSELVPPGAAISGGGVYDANATVLATLLEADDALTTVLPCQPDEPDRVLACLLDAAASHDLVVTAGGISAGAYEVVRQALEPLGSVDFGRVAMTPGRPQGYGLLGSTPVVALPGNPSAALVSYIAFGRPLLQRARGAAGAPATILVALGAVLPARRDATRFVPAVLDRRGPVPVAHPLGGGHHLSSFTDADVLLRIDPRQERLEAGTHVPGLLV